jgi:hypothetical protein
VRVAPILLSTKILLLSCTTVLRNVKNNSREHSYKIKLALSVNCVKIKSLALCLSINKIA